ncbi:hypothetical protein [Brevibacterium aurantiacum]|uniref:Uncharacterized protein n=1 Tax=Brevibacterium aurantiacum TaxID=273384 RepID=A0A2H1KJM0_BREAU|nr:hypothetical protein [Brevibacterium aurantiacum]AZT94182.1 hypothetical protein CXR23_14350 [Brevibacterium aurantiacum]GEB24704.1 hypothetical protein BAU01nite_34370 [Brevibacterium aurantiacum]SMX99738.1 hypothetical protein BAUR9175_03555 [Brevibacterium aurantiacum]
MPATREFSRTAAALGTALALVLLPLTGTIAPAQASPTAVAEASVSDLGTTDVKADGSTDGTDAASAADSGDSDSASSEADSNSNGSDDGADAGADAADPNAEADDDASEDDPKCDDPSDGGDTTTPCAVEDPIDSTWNPSDQTMQLSDMPESWEGKKFAGPKQNNRWPAQSTSEPEGTTDDSGNPLPEATNDAPSKYSFDEDGYVLNDDTGKRMEFTAFEKAPDPVWAFTSDGTTISVVEGEAYPPPSDGDNSDAGATAGANSNETADPDGGTADSSSGAGMSASEDSEAKDDGSTSDSDSDTGSTGNKENSDSSSDTSASSDSNSSDSAQADSKDTDSSTTADADSAQKESDSNSSASSNDSDSGNSDSVGNADKDGSSSNDNGKDDKGSADQDGSGTTSGDDGPNREDTTPDPATGNGSSDTRDEIPGDVGDDWMPGNGDAPPPDYSDPVPQNPDTPVPDDDTDLITGGNTPEPRSDKPPSTSFGESIVSTIVSSWPIFILAASGMAAVGFIIWIVGRRNKQN